MTKKNNYPQIFGFFFMHIAALILALRVEINLDLFVLFLACYILKFLGFSLALHRYFSHKCFQTSRVFQFILSLWSNLSFMRGPIRFVSGHRHHHKFSDTQNDLHSPHEQGFLQAYCGWVFSKGYHETKLGLPHDLVRYKELEFSNKFYFLPNFLMYGILYYFGGVNALFWGGLLSTLAVWHMAFLSTVGFHYWGENPYVLSTKDHSKNNLFLAIMTLGEGWHNNHHFQMGAANLGHKSNEFDFTFFIIQILEKLKLVWRVQRYKLEE